MPIVGNLSEFPLPEVLLLIGFRTGRLRLLDIPEFGVLDMDISNGEIHALRTGSVTFNECQTMLEKLGTIMQAQDGMFEFRTGPISLNHGSQAMTIHELAMKLVCHVDEQLARARLVAAADQCYRLVTSPPDIWVEPELNQFFHTIHALLADGVTLNSLARHLQMETGMMHEKLTHLRLLGLIELANDEAPSPVEDNAHDAKMLAPEENIFLPAGPVLDRVRKLMS